MEDIHEILAKQPIESITLPVHLTLTMNLSFQYRSLVIEFSSIALLYPKCVDVRNAHLGYPKSECAIGISQMRRSFGIFACPKCAFIPNAHFGYPKCTFGTISQMNILDNVPNAYFGHPKC